MFPSLQRKNVCARLLIGYVGKVLTKEGKRGEKIFKKLIELDCWRKLLLANSWFEVILG